MSALGSSCACPTAFITFCPSWRLQRIQFHRHVQPAPSLNGWGCDLQDSIGLGVHPGQWSLLHPVLLLAGTHVPPPPPGSGWLSGRCGGGGGGRGLQGPGCPAGVAGGEGGRGLQGPCRAGPCPAGPPPLSVRPTPPQLKWCGAQRRPGPRRPPGGRPPGHAPGAGGGGLRGAGPHALTRGAPGPLGP